MNSVTRCAVGLLLCCGLAPAFAQAQQAAAPVPMSLEQEQALRANPVKCVKPVYPKAELRAEHQGTVNLSFMIDVDGKVRDYKIVKSTGFPALDEAAAKSLMKCQFLPKRNADGVPEKVWVPVDYVWYLG